MDIAAFIGNRRHRYRKFPAGKRITGGMFMSGLSLGIPTAAWENEFSPDALGDQAVVAQLYLRAGFIDEITAKAIASFEDVALSAAASSIGVNPNGRKARYRAAQAIAGSFRPGDRELVQKNAAKALGMSKGYFSKYLSAHSSVSLERATEVSVYLGDFFGVSPLWIQDGDAYGLSNWQSIYPDDFTQATKGYAGLKLSHRLIPHLPIYLEDEFLAIESGNEMVAFIRSQHRRMLDDKSKYKRRGKNIGVPWQPWLRHEPSWEDGGGKWMYRFLYLATTSDHIIHFPDAMIRWTLLFPRVFGHLRARSEEVVLSGLGQSITRDDIERLRLAYEISVMNPGKPFSAWTDEAQRALSNLLLAAGHLSELAPSLRMGSSSPLLPAVDGG